MRVQNSDSGRARIQAARTPIRRFLAVGKPPTELVEHLASQSRWASSPKPLRNSARPHSVKSQVDPARIGERQRDTSRHHSVSTPNTKPNPGEAFDVTTRVWNINATRWATNAEPALMLRCLEDSDSNALDSGPGCATERTRPHVSSRGQRHTHQGSGLASSTLP